MSDLCEECKEKVINKFSEGRNIEGFWMDIFHCHHELKERAKCFCCLDGKFIPLYRTSRIYEDIKDSKFCPECGRRLSE